MDVSLCLSLVKRHSDVHINLLKLFFWVHFIWMMFTWFDKSASE